jgi:hypothetical protein
LEITYQLRKKQTDQATDTDKGVKIIQYPITILTKAAITKNAKVATLVDSHRWFQAELLRTSWDNRPACNKTKTR